MSRTAINIRRIKNDIKMCDENNIIYEKITDKEYAYKVALMGPSDTPYEGGVFILSVEFTPEYPMKPPLMNFITPIYHPNIGTDGHICLDTLQNNWSAALKLYDVILSIQSLLNDPNPSSPMNGTAAELYISSINKSASEKEQKSYYEECQKWISEHCHLHLFGKLIK